MIIHSYFRCLAALATGWGIMLSADAAITVKCTPDHADHLYRSSEPVRLTFAADDDGRPLPRHPICYTLRQEDGLTAGGEIITGPDGTAVLTTALQQPGFLILATTAPDGQRTSLTGIGCEPEKIAIDAHRPADFDQFWEKQLRLLEEVPLQELAAVPVEVEPGYRPQVEAFDVKVSAYGERPVSGYLSMPKDARPGSLPAFVWFHGAGVHSSTINADIAAQGLLAFNVNAHGIENGRDKAYYQELDSGELQNYFLSGRTDRERYYFRNMFLRVVRALEYLKSRPEWDGKNLIVFGGSQGGAQALVAAALDQDVNYCFAQVPWMCNFRGAETGCHIPEWPGFLPPPDDPDYAAACRTLPYYDMINFAGRIGCHTEITVGFVDEVCCPSGVYAMFNALRSREKTIFPVPSEGHGDSIIYVKGVEQMLAVLKKLQETEPAP